MSRPVRFSTTTFPEISPPALIVLVERTSVAESEGLATRIAAASAAMLRTIPAAMEISRVRLTHAMLSLGSMLANLANISVGP